MFITSLLYIDCFMHRTAQHSSVVPRKKNVSRSRYYWGSMFLQCALFFRKFKILQCLEIDILFQFHNYVPSIIDSMIDLQVVKIIVPYDSVCAFLFICSSVHLVAEIVACNFCHLHLVGVNASVSPESPVFKSKA